MSAPDTTQPPDTTQRTDLELRYAWDWFQYHASQRLTAFNFFLLLTSAVILGYTDAAEKDAVALGIAVAVLGVIVSVGFILMDMRNAELVRHGLQALGQVEEDLPRARITAADSGRSRFKRWVVTHRFWLRAIEGVVGIASLAALVWAICGFPGQPPAGD